MPRTLALSTPGLSRRGLRRLVGLVVLVGVSWRLTRYLLCFPVWGDEAMLLVNYPGRGFLDLLGPLEHCQVAPLLFHAAELLALRAFGSGELAVRLPPLLAGLGSLVLFARLARLLLPPLASGLAVALLAVSIWPATLASLTKPYTFDLFFSLALLLPAAMWWRRPDRLAPLLWLVLVVPVAVLASYPAVFVGAAIAVAATGSLACGARHEVGAARGLLLLFLVLLVGTFAVHYFLVAKPQLASPVAGSTTAREMAAYWRHGFPPTQPVALAWWLLLAHTGQMAAYPLGAAAGGSTATVLLALAGARRLWRRRRWFVGLVAALFVLGLIAAALRGYPYGASCRLAQHLAPVYCLLAGQGLAVLLGRRRRATVAVFVALAMLGLGGLGRDLWRPYRDGESLWARHLAREVAEHAGGEPVLAITAHEHSFPLLRWHLGRQGHAVLRAGQETASPARRDGTSLWVLAVDLPPETGALAAGVGCPGRSWRCVERRSLPRATLPAAALPRAHLSRWRCEAK